MFLVTVDHYSDFIEVDNLPDTLASTIVDKTEPHFARNGAPAVILTDNGPQFISQEYSQLCFRYGTKHVTSSPYWPQGNGKAEASVKIVKNILKKCGRGLLYESLLNQRNTPPQGCDKSPAQRSMSRRTRGLLPITDRLLIPEGCDNLKVRNSIYDRRLQAKRYYDRKAGKELPEVEIGDTVYLKPSPHNKGKPWMYGVVTEKPTPRSYVVDTPSGKKVRRNSVQVRPSMIQPRPQNSPQTTGTTTVGSSIPNALSIIPILRHCPPTDTQLESVSCPNSHGANMKVLLFQ